MANQPSFFDDPPTCPHCGGDASSPNHWLTCDGRQGKVEALEPSVDMRGMVHRDDPHTSVEAAAQIETCRTELHARVRVALATRGPMTDEELEQLEEFYGYGPSTIRKRRSELYQAGALVVVGERRNARGFKMLVWDLVSHDAP